VGKTERNTFVLGVPTAVFASLLRDFSLELLRVYAVVIYVLCAFVLLLEYTRHFDVHKRKDPVLDALILGTASLGLRNFGVNANDLIKALWWVVLFQLSVCVWDFYTMLCNNYLTTGDEPWTSWLTLLVEPLFPFRRPVETLHRDEYRYWLIVDTCVFAIITSVLLLFSSSLHMIPDVWLRWLIVTMGAVGQLINVFRYLVVFKRMETANTLE
jgi:hypothetical protein